MYRIKHKRVILPPQSAMSHRKKLIKETSFFWRLFNMPQNLWSQVLIGKYCNPIETTFSRLQTSTVPRLFGITSKYYIYGPLNIQDHNLMVSSMIDNGKWLLSVSPLSYLMNFYRLYTTFVLPLSGKTRFTTTSARTMIEPTVSSCKDFMDLETRYSK